MREVNDGRGEKGAEECAPESTYCLIIPFQTKEVYDANSLSTKSQVLEFLLLYLRIRSASPFISRTNAVLFSTYSMDSNLAILTQSHRAVAAKKREKRNQIKEIVFDEDARRYAW